MTVIDDIITFGLYGSNQFSGSKRVNKLCCEVTSSGQNIARYQVSYVFNNELHDFNDKKMAVCYNFGSDIYICTLLGIHVHVHM